ncbi:MAG TPA: hypothetical protein EYP08_07010 [Pyrodictiaceae archaeon]|nr:hypothetical protein [Pyrodictiaceae archaeon]
MSEKSKTWIKELRKVLDELGISYEAEENVRVHVGEVVVQIGEFEEGEKGYYVTASINLPSSESTLEEFNYYMDSFKVALKLMLGLTGEMRYELDTSLPDYPVLHITRKFNDAGKLVENLKNILKKLVEEGIIGVSRDSVVEG